MSQSQQPADVSFTRAEVEARLPDWQLINDCIAGERTIKEAGSTYLPMPNADDQSEENVKRYLQYIKRAVFYNVTKRTHAGLTALAFVEPPTITVPSGIDFLVNDIDGGGISLQQQMQAVLGKVAALGRCGLLTDYPPMDKPVSRANLRPDLGVRPFVRVYSPEDIINWRTINIGARRVPRLIVLAETYDVDTADGFGLDTGKQWRVLRLEVSDAGNLQYTVTIYRDVEGEGRTPVEQYVVRGYNGQTFDTIPFVAVGSKNNDLDVDDSPMLDLANMNIAHYRNSADREEMLFMCGQPTPTLTNMTKDWWETVLFKKVRLGSRSSIPLPANSELKLVQAIPTELLGEAMRDKERQMVALGARLIQTREVQRTAAEARIETASEMSILDTCSHNTAAAYVQSLAWAGLFAGVSGESTIDIHANAELERMTPDERTSLMAELQNGGISWTEYRQKMRKSGIAIQDDKQAAAEIAVRKTTVAVPQQQQ